MQNLMQIATFLTKIDVDLLVTWISVKKEIVTYLTTLGSSQDFRNPSIAGGKFFVVKTKSKYIA